MNHEVPSEFPLGGKPRLITERDEILRFYEAAWTNAERRARASIAEDMRRFKFGFQPPVEPDEK